MMKPANFPERAPHPEDYICEDTDCVCNDPICDCGEYGFACKCESLGLSNESIPGR